MTTETVLKHVAVTHPGRVREHNEDCFHADILSGLFLVADGMGGMEAGEVASAIARDETVRAVGEGSSLTQAIQHAHAAIRDAVEKGIGAVGMGTTIVALRMQGLVYQVSWVGDSRAYLWDAAKGSLRRLSRDHSHVELLLASGVITPDQAHKHPQKNLITQCLGQPNLEQLVVGDVHGTLLPGQCIVLCSDGLNDELTDTEIAQCLVSNQRLQSKADALLNKTLDNGANDNVTIVIVQPEVGGWRQRLLQNRSLVFAGIGVLLALALLGCLKLLVGGMHP